ncbi:uncharacterized protein [Coffea arabica]|uniref:Aquaporin AQPAn.G-like n=1 Tax=Coffea arabica TaxID=13443 RepID=A0ABM4WFS9_COFAR|nr:aquaporin-like [Coffea arabica]
MAADAGNVYVNMEEESQAAGNRMQPMSTTPVPAQWTADEKKQTAFSLSERLGLDEFLSLNVWRAALGELLGTAVLVFMFDTIVISTLETDVKMPNLILSILLAIIIAILLLAVDPVSGGHINPIVSFSAGLIGLISMSRAIIYIIAQCAGGVLGALALKAVVSSNIERTFSLAGCTLTVIAPGPEGPVTKGLEAAQAFWLEAFCSFVFLFASIWILFDHRQRNSIGMIRVFSIIGIVLGLLVFVSTTVTATKGYAGAGMNPARCFGAAVVRGGHLWEGHWIFWAGPAVACLAFYVYTLIIPDDHFHVEGYKHDFFGILRTISGLER